MTQPDTVKTLAIVGGGFSGTLLAIRLLTQCAGPLRVVLAERAERVGQGLAYSTREACHLLNVPAGNMSLFPEQPGHFLAWLAQREPTAQATTFAPRRVYHEYLRDTLEKAVQQKAEAVCFEVVQAEVTDVNPLMDRGFALQLSSGNVLQADVVVLALGNAPSAWPAFARDGALQGDRFIEDPWATPDSVANIPAEEDIFIIGTGLTMIDKVVELTVQGHQGNIIALSRSGLMPQPHDLAQKPLAHGLSEPLPSTARELFRLVRQRMAQGHNWRSVIDGLRPLTQALWGNLPPVERRRFLRHLRAHWDNHRHRMAPEVAARIAALQASGQLRVLAGRIQACRMLGSRIEVVYRPRRAVAPETVRVGCVLNCTGSGTDFRRRQEPLVQNLLASGLMTPDPLGLGLWTTETGQLLGSGQQPVAGLFTLGPPLKGQLWETTAVPEIREQAARLAETLSVPLGLPGPAGTPE